MKISTENNPFSIDEVEEEDYDSREQKDTLDMVIQNNGISPYHSTYDSFFAILYDIFLMERSNSLELASAWLLKNQELPTSRYRLALSLIANAFDTFYKEKKIVASYPNPDYVGSALRIMNNLIVEARDNEDFGLEWNVVDNMQLMLTEEYLGIFLEICSDFARYHKYEVKKGKSRTVKAIDLDGELYIPLEYHIALNDYQFIFFDSREKRKKPIDIAQENFVNGYLSKFRQYPSPNLLYFTMEAIRSYLLGPAPFVHHIMQEEVNNPEGKYVPSTSYVLSAAACALNWQFELTSRYSTSAEYHMLRKLYKEAAFEHLSEIFKQTDMGICEEKELPIFEKIYFEALYSFLIT
jgi:hypothetical protein